MTGKLCEPIRGANSYSYKKSKICVVDLQSPFPGNGLSPFSSEERFFQNQTQSLCCLIIVHRVRKTINNFQEIWKELMDGTEWR